MGFNGIFRFLRRFFGDTLGSIGISGFLQEFGFGIYDIFRDLFGILMGYFGI